MLRDNPEGSSSRWLSSAGGPSPALHVDGRKSSDDRPSCLENPRPAGAESTLTENASSPFHAEPRQLLLSDAEKATLAEIAQRLGRKALEELSAVAKPDTLLAWYRKLIANKFDGSKFRKSRGRPRVDEETERLVVLVSRRREIVMLYER